MMMVGCMDGERTIWFDVEYEGQLSGIDDDLHRFNDWETQSILEDDVDHPIVSYVVARGGRVYQLGDARPLPPVPILPIETPQSSKSIEIDWGEVLASATWKSLKQFGGVVLLSQLILFGLTVTQPSPSSLQKSALRPVTVVLTNPSTVKTNPSTSIRPSISITSPAALTKLDAGKK